jgi:hypothetical protein
MLPGMIYSLNRIAGLLVLSIFIGCASHPQTALQKRFQNVRVGVTSEFDFMRDVSAIENNALKQLTNGGSADLGVFMMLPESKNWVRREGGKQVHFHQFTLNERGKPIFVFTFTNGILAEKMNSHDIIARRSTPESHRALDRVYRDPNNFFVAVIPEGWQPELHSYEKLYSKVQFFPPAAQKGCHIEVISTPTPRSSFSFDDVVAEEEGKTQVFKRLYPDASVTFQQRKVLDRYALVQRVVGQTINMESVVFIEDNTLYQLSLYAGSSKDQVQCAGTFQRFLNSFTILQPGRIFTDEERVAAIVQRAKYMADRFSRVGQTRMALEAVLDALVVDPKNEELLDLKAKLKNEQTKD